MNRKYLIIPEYEQLDKTMELAEQYSLGFEYNDFFHPRIYSNEEEVKNRCNTYLKLPRDRGADTLHGVFLDMAVTSRDPQIRSYSRKKVEQSLEIGERLGVRGVVFHSGLIAELQIASYLDSWLYESEAFWRIMAKNYSGVEIYLENSFEKTPEMLIRLKQNMEDVKNFKLCLDYGHACLTPTPVAEWAKKMGPYVGHIHLNDHDLRADLHQVPGEGALDFQQCKSLMEEYLAKVPILLELNGIEQQRKALEYMTKL